MAPAKSRIGNLLGIAFPVIQAPMLWITSAQLVAAVSEAGGLGVLGPNAGQTTVTTDPAETAERFRQEIRKTRALTSKPFGVNFLLPMEGEEASFAYPESIFPVILEEKVDAVISVGKNINNGLAYIRKFKEAGITVLHRELSPTVENSREVESAGVDALIITGHEAGGILSEHRISTPIIVSQVTEIVRIPVIAAGGIYNRKTAGAAREFGADGVYAGTRFIATSECPAAAEAKAAIVKTRSEDLLELRTPGGMARVIPVPGLDLTRNIDGSSSTKIAMLDGDLENGLVCVSESAGGIKEIVPAADVVKELGAAFSCSAN